MDCEDVPPGPDSLIASSRSKPYRPSSEYLSSKVDEASGNGTTSKDGPCRSESTGKMAISRSGLLPPTSLLTMSPAVRFLSTSSPENVSLGGGVPTRSQSSNTPKLSGK